MGQLRNVYRRLQSHLFHRRRSARREARHGGDAQAAFEPLSPVTLELDRIETNPRFAAIARPANAAILVKLRIDMEDRGGRIEMLLPYATLEPIRELLLQMFMGEKFGRDSIWESHLATELWSTKVPLEAVLDEQKLSLRDVMDFKVGQTLMLNNGPDALVEMRCGGVSLAQGRIGRMGNNVAVRIENGIKKKPHADATEANPQAGARK
jgi:flagellar motor switch protein FliM